ncbi:MAG: hypothetical protein KF764_20520 [Labilithrix sp.]|nr:hypothetical protein [Labilithrix sp.]
METESPDSRTTIGWAGSALILTAVVAIVAKVAGVIVAPGSRGVLSGKVVNVVETASGALAYTLTALLVALVCGASFELARARGVNVLARGGVVAVSGLIVALASPAVVERLSTLPSLALAVITSLVAMIAGAVVIRSPETRAVGGILMLLAICGLLRVVAWETSAVSFERASHRLHDVARGFATAAISLQAIASLLAAAWIGTRSKWRGRVLANLAIVLAFGITWLAARASDSPSSVEAVLRATLPGAAGLPSPYLLGSIGAFLVPASLLLATVALLQRAEAPAVVASLALALLSHGAFDVPLHALLVTASAQWAMLAMTDDRSRWAALVARRSETASPRPAGGTTESA